MQQKEIYQQHRLLTALTHKHPNRYVAVVKGKVIAMGKDQFKVFEAAEKKIKSKKETIGIFYLPGKKKILYLLVNRVHSL